MRSRTAQESFIFSDRWRTLLALVPYQPAKAMAIFWWWLTGRRVRALERLRDAMIDNPSLYYHWLSTRQPYQQDSRGLKALRVESGELPPFAVHLHLTGQNAYMSALNSVLSQAHRHWTLYITADGPVPALPDDSRIHVLDGPFSGLAEGLARTLEVAKESHLVPLAPKNTLTPGALIAFARLAKVTPDAVLYADQDEAGAKGRRNPWFKPQWDQELFIAQDYISDACAIPVKVARTAGTDNGWPDDIVVYALLTRLLLLGASPSRIAHVPYVATTTPADHWQRERPNRAPMISAHLGLQVRTGPFGTLSLLHPLPSPPPNVSVIVPTRDKMELLRTCVSGVLQGTDYPALELIVADNESIEPETLDYLAWLRQDPRVKVVRWPHPYNYSAINNFAVKIASGPYICLLNNDTEVIDPAWLTELMTHAVRPEVGAVGAQLLYPDRSIQHAGVVVGLGNAAGHAHRGQEENAPGYFAQAHVARSATAVTAACLVIAKEKFEAVGGFDEQLLGIAYNDVDLCLKLRAAGWRNIYAPQAVMIHHESKSRGADFAPEHRERYERELSVLQERWGTTKFVDPAHHVALDPSSEIYRLRL